LSGEGEGSVELEKIEPVLDPPTDSPNVDVGLVNEGNPNVDVDGVEDADKLDPVATNEKGNAVLPSVDVDWAEDEAAGNPNDDPKLDPVVAVEGNKDVVVDGVDENIFELWVLNIDKDGAVEGAAEGNAEVPVLNEKRFELAPVAGEGEAVDNDGNADVIDGAAVEGNKDEVVDGNKDEVVGAAAGVAEGKLGKVEVVENRLEVCCCWFTGAVGSVELKGEGAAKLDNEEVVEKGDDVKLGNADVWAGAAGCVIQELVGCDGAKGEVVGRAEVGVAEGNAKVDVGAAWGIPAPIVPPCAFFLYSSNRHSSNDLSL
jgi:hypothetical protein